MLKHQSFILLTEWLLQQRKKLQQGLKHSPEVETILPNETRELHTATITDDVAPQSAIANVEWNVDRVNAPDAWALGIDGSGTVVGV